MYHFRIEVKLMNTDNAEAFVSKCTEFEEDIDYDCGGNRILDAKSLLGIMTTDLRNKAIVKIHTNNPMIVDKFFKEFDKWKAE